MEVSYCPDDGEERETYGISDGVSGLEVAGGRLMRVGCDAAMIAEMGAAVAESRGKLSQFVRAKDDDG